MSTFSLEDIRNAKIELVDGDGKGSGIYGETLAEVYADNTDSYIDVLRYPLELKTLILNYYLDVEKFNVKINDIIYAAYDFGGEYLAIERIGGEVTFYAIESNI